MTCLGKWFVGGMVVGAIIAIFNWGQLDFWCSALGTGLIAAIIRYFLGIFIGF